MKRRNIAVILLVLSILFPIAHLSITAQGKVVNTTVNTTFSIMQITDTQHLAFLSPILYNELSTWIIDNAATYNLKMVVHTGDFIDAFGPNPTPPPPVLPYTTAQKAQEWEVANTAMSKLLDAAIPYCWCAGNHDPEPPFDPTSNMPGSSYSAFNAPSMRAKPYWVSDTFDSKNTAVKFSFGTYQFMVIDIEYLATNSVLDWTTNLLDQNPDVNVFIATHSYLNENGGIGTAKNPSEGPWAEALRNKLNEYPNVFLLLCGHNYGEVTTSFGNRQEILFDRQEEDGKLGAASVRIYTFNLENSQVMASTFNLVTDAWLTDAKNQFSFSVNLIKDMFVGEGRVDIDHVRYQGDTTVFVKSTTIDVIVENMVCTWTISSNNVRNNMETYDGYSGLGRITVNINNGCVVANGPEVHFQSNG